MPLKSHINIYSFLFCCTPRHLFLCSARSFTFSVGHCGLIIIPVSKGSSFWRRFFYHEPILYGSPHSITCCFYIIDRILYHVSVSNFIVAILIGHIAISLSYGAHALRILFENIWIHSLHFVTTRYVCKLLHHCKWCNYIRPQTDHCCPK